MYFQQLNNQQATGCGHQPMPPIYNQSTMFGQQPTQQGMPPIYNQSTMFGQQPTQPVNSFMYPTKLQPYNDRQFLCKTFNFRVPLIEAFLSLGHEQKLKFFLICEGRRLTGELTDRETYGKVLEKITMIVNPNYKKPQEEYKPISEEELKKKIMEREFEQKCEWELRKLGLGDGDKGQQQVNSPRYLTGGNANFMSNSIAQANSVATGSSGLSMNFDEFGFGEIKPVRQVKTAGQQMLSGKQEEDEFVYQQATNQPQVMDNWIEDRAKPTVSRVQTIQQQPSYQLSKSQAKQQDEEWQQAEEVTETQPTSSYQSQSYQPTPPSQNLPFNKQAESKVESIWDLQIDESQLKQSEPDIKQIFGIKGREEDDFGGFQQAHAEQHNYTSFLKQNEFRYETVAEVDNDWLLGTTDNNQAFIGKGNSDQFIVKGDSDQLIDEMGNQQVVNSVATGLEAQRSFDSIAHQQPLAQPETPALGFQPYISKNQQNSNVFDINQFDVSSHIIPQSQTQTYQAQTKPLNNSDSTKPLYNSDSLIPSMPNPIDFDMGIDFSQNQNQQDLSIPIYEIQNQVTDFQVGNFQTEKKHEEDQWEEGEEVVVEQTKLPDHTSHSYAQPIIQKPQQMALGINQLSFSHQQTLLAAHTPQPNHSSTNEDPFATIQFNTSTQVNTQNIDTFSFAPQTNPMPQIQPPQFEQLSLPVAQKEIKPIKKIIKPPSMKKIEIQTSHFSHFAPESQKKPQESAPSNLSSLKQPTLQFKPSLQSPSLQANASSAFAKKPKLTAVNSLSISIAPSPRNAITTSTNLPPTTMSLSHIPDPLSASTYISSSKQQYPQKIISTYNKQMTYTPDSFRSSMKTMLTKSKTFFKTFSKNDKRDSGQQSKNEQIAEHYSMTDMQYVKNRQSLTKSHQGSAVRGPKVNASQGLGKSQNLDYSIDAHMMEGHKQKQVDGMNDMEELNEKESSLGSPFTKKQSEGKSTAQKMNDYEQTESPVGSSNEIEQNEERMKVLQSLSQKFVLKLPENEVSYLSGQLKKNNFFFNMQFYINLREMLERLSLKDDLAQFSGLLQRNHSYSLPFNTQSSVFSTQHKFISQIIKKLTQIQELNKKFTLAMQDDQEEQLAAVIMKSKQLTFEVSEDGDVAKRIVSLVVRKRGQGCQTEEEEIDEDTDKYYGMYYMMVKLVLQPRTAFCIDLLPEQNLAHLVAMFNDAASCSLASKSHFLHTCAILYILHTQLNQLRYIKNISQTIFTYLIKQHAILMSKINDIKQLSTKYAESPHSIFSKLMESSKMTEYLKGLGEMAMVAERLSGLGKRIGVKFEKEEFREERIARTVAEARQLAVKYNLLEGKADETSMQSLYSPYLAVLLAMTNVGKSVWEISSEMRGLLKQRPVCKVCLAPRKQGRQDEGDFISNGVTSSQSINSTDSIEWCHYSCYNMLKLAFEDASVIA